MAEINLTKSRELELTIPSPTGAVRSVIIPLTVDGLKIVKQVLHEREREPQARLGSPASPTQSQINEWLRNMKREQERETREAAGKRLEALGLDLSDITL